MSILGKSLGMDIRFTLRQWRQSPGFVLVAMLSLAIGIGANSAIFSFVDAILLRPLPVPHPEELVKVNAGEKDRFPNFNSYPDYLDFRRQNQGFSFLAAYGYRGASLQADGAPMQITVGVVSPDYFPLFGVKAAVGRTFGDEEDLSADASWVGVMSHRYWQRRFGGRIEAVGSAVRLNKRPCTLIGVMPPDFSDANLREAPDLWIPFSVWTQMIGESGSDRGHRWLEMMGRLRPGIAVESAQSEMRAIGRQLTLSYPKTNRDTQVTVVPESEAKLPWVQKMGRILLFLAAFVLLIACINLSYLLWARAEARETEFAVRRVLGTGSFRMMRQLWIESFLLTLFGTALALLLAAALIPLLPRLFPSEAPLLQSVIRLDGRVFAYTLLVSLLAVFGFGFLPALRTTKADLFSALKRNVHSTVGGFRGWTPRNLLIVSGMALMVMILVGTGLLLRTFWNVRQIPTGFRSENRILFWIVPAALGYNDAQLQAFYQDLLTRVQGLPGVKQATLVQRPPLFPIEGGQRYPVKIPGYEVNAGERQPAIRYTIVWPNYFETVGTPILRGRTFSGLETAQGLGSLLINEAMARRYWPDQDPVGKHIQVLGKECEIVGVVSDGRYVNLREEASPYMYLSIPQFSSSDMTLLVNASGDMQALAASVERELHGLARDLPVPEVSTLAEHHRRTYENERAAAILTACLSGMAIFLAAVGLYGLISSSVKRRTQEIGVRMALGARTTDVLRMVLQQSLRLVFGGICLGVVAALWLTRFLSSQLYGVTSSDPWTYAAVIALIYAVVLAAALLPARRAARVDPIIALRTE